MTEDHYSEFADKVEMDINTRNLNRPSYMDVNQDIVKRATMKMPSTGKLPEVRKHPTIESPVV